MISIGEGNLKHGIAVLVEVIHSTQHTLHTPHISLPHGVVCLVLPPGRAELVTKTCRGCCSLSKNLGSK